MKVKRFTSCSLGVALAAATMGGCATLPGGRAFNLSAIVSSMNEAVPLAMREGNVCGAVVLVGVRRPGGFDIWQQAYGLRRTEPAAEPMTVDAIFDLASLTKPVAAGTAIMVLADRGRVSLDDPVGRYLPEFAAGDKAAVTIRHLLTHTSGEKPYLGEAERKNICGAAGGVCTAALRDYVRTVSLAAPPGERVTYSCLNAILCAEIIRAVSGQELDEFCHANIFAPLKMSETCFLPSEMLRPRICPTTRSPRGLGEGGFLQGQVHDPLAALQGGVSGNAGLFSTAGDLSRFARMMLNRGELDGVRILKPETVDEMLKPAAETLHTTKGKPDIRGLGWDIYEDEPGGEESLSAGHTGYTGVSLRLYPRLGVYVILLPNRVHPDDKAVVVPLRKAVAQIIRDQARKEEFVRR